jgi:soluble lytic murein transglycosylase-like protein
MAPNGFYEKGYGGEIFQSMMDEVLAQKLAERKNLGIAEALIRQFAQFLPEADSANNAEDRPSNFALLIDAAAQRHAVDAALLRAVIEQESAGNPRAVSPKGAAGLMQLMPETAERLGVDDRFDAGQNIDGGARYLAELLRRFGTVEAALAAYNAGPEAVERYGGVPPYPETQEYVKRVIAKYRALTATSNESEAVKNNSVKLKTEAWQLLNVPRGLKDHTE